MTTAAEALEEVLALIRLQGDDEALWFVAITAPEGYLQYQLRMLHEVIETHAATLRAALAPPQTGEVEECAQRLLNAFDRPHPLDALHQQAARLLRASAAPAPEPDDDVVYEWEPMIFETKRERRARLNRAAPQPAPEPVAKVSDGYHGTDGRGIRWKVPLSNQPKPGTLLYAAPPQPEAVALLKEVMVSVAEVEGPQWEELPRDQREAITGKTAYALGHAAGVMRAVERIRAYLARTGGKEEK